MARVLYGDGKKVGEVEDWQQRQDAAVYKTFLGKTALVSAANVECTFTSPKPLKRKMQLMIIEDGETQLDLTIVRVIDGTQVIAKIRERKPLPTKNKS